MQCAHLPCTCMPMDDTTYCSESCASSPAMLDNTCDCGHAECEASRRGAEMDTPLP